MPTTNFAGQKVVIDAAALADFVRSPNGPVVRGMLIVGDQVIAATRASMRSQFPRDFLGPRLVKRVNMAPDGPHVLVGSDQVQTRRHPIDPKGHPFLKFKGRDGVVYVRHVDHPGSNFAPYLLARLRLALRAVRL